MLAKLEYLNPGGRIKDRIGLPMIEAAERAGLLRPGRHDRRADLRQHRRRARDGRRRARLSLHLRDGRQAVARRRSSSCARFGAEVVVCPTNVEPADPRSYYSVSRRLAEETPNAFNPNQYANPANPAAHYATTGPEIWEQLGEELDYLVVGVGTGGTVTGVGAVPQGAEPGDHDRRRRSRGLDLHRRRPLVPDRGGRARTSGPRRSTPRSSTAGCRSRIATRSSRARRVAAAEGILIGGSCGMARAGGAATWREELDAGQDGARDPARRRAAVPVEGVRRRLDAVEHGLLDRPGLPPIVAELMHAKSREEPEHPVDRHDRGRRAELATRSTCCSATASRSCPWSRRRARRRLGRRRRTSSARSRSDPLLDRVFREGGEVLARPVEELMAPPLAIVDVHLPLDDLYGDAAVAARARRRRRAPPGRRRADAHRPARVPRPPRDD